MIKKLAVIGLVLTSASAMAWSPFDSKIAIYECTSEQAARQCSSACKPINDVKVEYKVNPANNSVIQSAYSNGNLDRSDALEGCTVVDNKNWVCDRKSDHANGGWSYATVSMTKGQLYSFHEYFMPRLDKNITRTFSCGK